MTSQPLFLSFGIFIALATFISLRREHIRPEHSTSWLAVGLLIIFFSCSPQLLLTLAGALHIEAQSVLPGIALTLLFGLVFGLAGMISKLRDEKVTLAQRIAILDYKVTQLELERGVRGDAGDTATCRN